MRIEVLIEEVVLHGVEPSERHALGDALTVELERVLAADAATWSQPRTVDVARVVGAGVRIERNGAAAPALAGAVRAAIGAAVSGGEVAR
jgi:hypothetical protein